MYHCNCIQIVVANVDSGTSFFNLKKEVYLIIPPTSGMKIENFDLNGESYTINGIILTPRSSDIILGTSTLILKGYYSKKGIEEEIEIWKGNGWEIG